MRSTDEEIWRISSIMSAGTSPAASSGGVLFAPMSCGMKHTGSPRSLRARIKPSVRERFLGFWSPRPPWRTVRLDGVGPDPFCGRVPPATCCGPRRRDPVT